MLVCIEILYSLGLGNSIIECELLGREIEFFALLTIDDGSGSLQKLLDDLLVCEHTFEVVTHCIRQKLGELLGTYGISTLIYTNLLGYQLAQ